eukprot:2328433-Amphidinium_carterae.1
MANRSYYKWADRSEHDADGTVWAGSRPRSTPSRAGCFAGLQSMAWSLVAGWNFLQACLFLLGRLPFVCFVLAPGAN